VTDTIFQSPFSVTFFLFVTILGLPRRPAGGGYWQQRPAKKGD
jgi:hypothetical protein